MSFSDIDEMLGPRAASAPENSPEQLVLRARTSRVSGSGLEVLTERERTALLLRDVEGLPAEEVAAQLNCSKATVRSHIANARVKFRSYMDAARGRMTCCRQNIRERIWRCMPAAICACAGALRSSCMCGIASRCRAALEEFTRLSGNVRSAAERNAPGVDWAVWRKR